MEDIGMSEVEINNILSIIAAILKLGNLSFVPITNMDGTEGCALGNEYGNALFQGSSAHFFIH